MVKQFKITMWYILSLKVYLSYSIVFFWFSHRSILSKIKNKWSLVCKLKINIISACISYEWIDVLFICAIKDDITNTCIINIYIILISCQTNPSDVKLCIHKLKWLYDIKIEQLLLCIFPNKLISSIWIQAHFISSSKY